MLTEEMASPSRNQCTKVFARRVVRDKASAMTGRAISITGGMIVFLLAQTDAGEEHSVQRLDSINADPGAGQTVVQQVYQ